MIQPYITGEELGGMLRKGARDAGLSLDKFAASLSPNPGKWVNQVEAIERPRSQTVARVLALIEGRELPPPANASQFNRRRANYVKSAYTNQAETDPPPIAIDRDPCLRCGVRADLHAAQGCKRWSAP